MPSSVRDLATTLAFMNLEGLAKALTRFDARSASRGRNYVREDRVRKLELDRRGEGFAASVRGASTYRSEWIADPVWRNGCSCPLGGDCKHAYAAACVVLSLEVPDAGRKPLRSKPLVPGGLGTVRQPPLRLVDLEFEPDDDGYDFEEDDYDEEDYDEADLDDPAPPKPARAFPIPVSRPSPPARTSRGPVDIGRLFELLHAAASREQRYALLGDIAHSALISPGSLNLWHLGQEEDRDVLCALVADQITRLGRLPLPPSVETWRTSPTALDKLRRRQERALHDQVEAWAQPAERRYQKHVRVVLRAKAGAGDHLAFEPVTLQTSAKLKDEARRPEQLRALLEEAGRRGDVLSPEAHALLDWICTFHISTAWWSRDGIRLGEIERLLIDFGHTGLITWQTGSASERLLRAGIKDGDTVRLSRDGASIEPVCTVEDGTARLEMRVRLGGLGTFALHEVVHLKSTGSVDPSWLLAEGALWRVQKEPPERIFEGFLALGTLKLDPERRTSILRRLAPLYPELSRTLGQYTALVPSRAVFLLDGETGEDLQLRLLAVPIGTDWYPDGLAASTDENLQTERRGAALSPDPLFEFTRDGTWQRLDRKRSVSPAVARNWHEMGSTAEEAAADAAAPNDDAAASAPGLRNDAADAAASNSPVAIEEAWLVEPDLEAVTPAVSWLRSLCPGSAGDAACWTTPLRAPHFDALASAWKARPRDAAFFATRRIKRLLGEGLRPMPKLDIRSSGKDFFAVKLDWQLEGEALSQADVTALLASDAEFVRLGNGWVRAAAREETRDLLGVLADLGIDASEDEQRLGLWQLAAAPPQALARLEKLGADPATVAAAQTLRRKVESFRGLPRVALPRTFHGELRAYQRDGLDFLAFTSTLGSGAVLADDMGLGKTVQTLAWLERLRLAGNTGGPALVVCPVSVVHNWLNEAARFAPKMRVAVLSSGRERHELREGDFDLFITNYALLRIDAEHWSKTELGALILDEAQNVKNPDAAVSKSVRSIAARHRLALTGTPLENRTRDLWSIVECVSPGYFGTRKRFEERFERTATVADADRRLLSAKLRPLMLRRRKSEVAPDLPARTEEVRRCELTAEQRRLYLVTLRASRRLVGELARKGAESKRARIQILAALTRLRQICCHPGLVDPKLAGAGSAKFDLLMELLEPLVAEGHKVLVFSQFAQCIQLIAGELRRRDIQHFVLTGATQKRERVVAAFQECAEPAVFLVSLKAGGTGLNLTAASYVVLFDPWWNPAVEAQAIDRTHRIGQTKSVMAYRLVAADTIEEKILELQRDKASLADAVVDDASFGKRLEKEDLARLLEE